MELKLNKYAFNPILTPRPNSGWDAAQTRNPAAILHDGKVHLIYTAAGDIDIEHKLRLGHAVSSDGFNFEFVGDKPFAEGAPDEFDGFDVGGMEDPRAVKIDNTIYISYCARSVPHWSFILGQRLENPPTNGVTWTDNYRRGGLITTQDLVSYKRLGPVTTDDHYDCNIILFPEKIDGQYAMLHRPSNFKAEIESGERNGAPGINICYSDNLIDWHEDIQLAKNEYPWEDGKIGGATPPIKTEDGWLTLYHAVEKRPTQCNWHQDHHFCYRTGVMLLDLEDPSRVLARAPYPILEPETVYEKFGTVNNVVFATGCVLLDDELFVYYGAADTVICVATIKLKRTTVICKPISHCNSLKMNHLPKPYFYCSGDRSLKVGLLLSSRAGFFMIRLFHLKTIPYRSMYRPLHNSIRIVDSRRVPDTKINHIVIISMDTTRADYLSCYGYEHKTTPNIDAVADEAVRFEHVIAPIPLTLPSHSTMMTGTIPPTHGIHDNLNYSLADSNVTLAEMLQAKGYTTGGIISSYVLEDTFGLDQGFDTYDDEFDETITDAAGAQRRGSEVSEHAIRWLEENQDEVFFLFLHYYDPHSPYNPPDEYKNLFVSKASTDDMDEKIKLSYAEEIAYTDHCIGQVIEKLRSLGLYDSTLLIITGDHGEGLGEHKEMGHGYFIYQPSIHVPLIVKLPGKNTTKTVSEITGLVDLTPTVCSLLGVEIPEHIQGRDLSGTLFDEPSESIDRYIYSESLLGTKYKASPLLAVTGNRFKYIQTARPELYDLIEDPGETRNLVDVQPQRARILQDMLGVMLEESLAANTSDSKLELDDESRKKLESLGYVGGALEEDFSFDQDKADPKDTFQYHLDLMDIMGLMQKKDYDAAEKACQAFISGDMEVPQVYSHLAQIAMEREDEPQAIEYLKKALALEPETASAQAQLGLLLLTTGDYEQALIHLKEAYQIQPKSANICYDVARAYYKLGNKEKAVEYCRKSLLLKPDYIEPRVNLGKALFELGDIHTAIKEYYRALKYDAENLKALNFLAWIQATSRDEQLRKPKEALKLAQRAAKAADYNNAEVMDTLAVAYASVGQFDQAIEKASEAIELAESSGEMALAQRIAKRRGLFQAGKTYNE